MAVLDTIAGFSPLSTGLIVFAAAIFTRISALAFFLPGLGERSIPVRIRLAVAMGITLVISPIVAPPAPVEAPSLSAIAMMLTAEAIAGSLLGFSLRIAVFALQTAGAIIGQNLSLSQLFGAGITEQADSSVATLLMLGGIVLAMAAGLHYQAIGILVFSYDIIPLGAFPGANDAGAWAAERAAYSFAVALSLSLPFIVLGFIYNLAIGAANRAMPQLMVAFVGAPAITLMGLVLLALAAPVVLNVWLDVMTDTVDTLMGQS